MMASTEFGRNIVRGPAKRPEWAQMIRLGGDRVAVLFGELRESVGKVDGIVERLPCLGTEGRWEVQYQVGATELFTARISPGLLEADIPLGRSEIEDILKMRIRGGKLRDMLGRCLNGAEPKRLNLKLENSRTVRSFVNLAGAKAKLAQKSEK